MLIIEVLFFFVPDLLLYIPDNAFIFWKYIVFSLLLLFSFPGNKKGRRFLAAASPDLMRFDVYGVFFTFSILLLYLNCCPHSPTFTEFFLFFLVLLPK